jgi:RNA polymerase sigma factor (sigma-70 family)
LSAERVERAHADASATQLAALAVAFEQHWEDLLVAARVWLHRADVRGDLHALAQDAVQDACTTAIRLAATYDPSRPARPWLRSILFNTIRTIARNRRTERRHVIGLEEAAAGALRQHDERGDPTADLSVDDLLDRLGASGDLGVDAGEQAATDLLGLVSPADAEILRLRYLEGYQGPLLAERLGCRTGTADVRLHRARTRLAAAYIRVNTDTPGGSPGNRGEGP